MRVTVFILTLLIVSLAIMASHCKSFPECGHGGPCAPPEQSNGCVNVPRQVGGDETHCEGTGGGSGGGGGGGPQPTPTPVIDAAFRGFGGEFSYNADCSQPIDPVTMLIRFNGANAEEHFMHHGVEVQTGGLQHFIDFETCVEGEYSTATNDGVKKCFGIPCGAESRMHVRCNVVGSAPDGGGTFASCTPHYDQAVTCNGVPKHAIPETMDNRWPGINPAASGFTGGRDYFYWVLVTVGDHEFIDARWWGNIQEVRQCNGWWTGSNGYVNHIDGR